MIPSALLKTDGGSRGNPGIAGIGFQIEADGQVICSGGWFIGETTNNVAEYQAMIWGLTNARALGVQHLDIRADSQLVVRQLQGAYKVKNAGLKPLYQEAKALLDSFPSHSLDHVYREENSLADSLANQAMDAQAPVGEYQVPFQDMNLFADL